MYLQTCREANAAKKDVEQPTKQEGKSVLADVILQTIPKEAQVGSPIGSPVMNGYRKELTKDSVIPKNATIGNGIGNGTANGAFDNDSTVHEDLEKTKNEKNKNSNDLKGGIDNAAFDRED